MTTETITIRQATHTDIPYIMALQRANRESVGGLPTPAITERINRNTLTLATINNDPVGYLLYDIRNGILRIAQACIQYDARRRTHGEALWHHTTTHHGPHITEARLRCAADIDANLFWRQQGFTCVGHAPGGTRRGRIINLWQAWYTTNLIPITDLATTPQAQRRIDCRDEQTGFLTTTPDGFNTAPDLGKLAWSNRPTPTPALIPAARIEQLDLWTPEQ